MAEVEMPEKTKQRKPLLLEEVSLCLFWGLIFIFLAHLLYLFHLISFEIKSIVIVILVPLLSYIFGRESEKRSKSSILFGLLCVFSILFLFFSLARLLELKGGDFVLVKISEDSPIRIYVNVFSWISWLSVPSLIYFLIKNSIKLLSTTTGKLVFAGCVIALSFFGGYIYYQYAHRHERWYKKALDYIQQTNLQNFDLYKISGCAGGSYDLEISHLQKHLQKAQIYLEKVTRHYPDDAKAHFLLALSYFINWWCDRCSIEDGYYFWIHDHKPEEDYLIRCMREIVNTRNSKKNINLHQEFDTLFLHLISEVGSYGRDFPLIDVEQLLSYCDSVIAPALIGFDEYGNESLGKAYLSVAETILPYGFYEERYMLSTLLFMAEKKINL